MDNFFEHLKDNLEQRPEPAYELRLWDRLQKEMDQEQQPRKRSALWWWLLVFAFLMLGSNAFLYRELRQANAHISKLELAIDTVYRTKIVYYPQEQPAPAVGASFRQDSSTPFGAQPIKPIWRQQPDFESSLKLPQGSIFQIVSHTLLPNFLPQALPEPETAPAETDDLNFPQLSAIPIVSKPLKGTAPTLTTKTKALASLERNRLKRAVYAMRPKAVRLGIHGHWTSPLQPYLVGEGSPGTSLEATIDLSPQWQFWAGAAYQTLHFETAENLGAQGIPSLAPPDDQYTFSTVEVVRPAWQYTIGLNYRLLKEARWTPTVGAAYAATTYLPFDALYAFQFNGQLLTIEEQVQARNSINNILLLRLGVDYAIHDHWRAQFRTEYGRSFGSVDFKPPTPLELKLGIQYKF